MPDDKPPMLWHSNAPMCGTGYAQQTALFAPRLREHYNLTISAFYGLEGAVIPWNGIPVLPGLANTYGNEMILEHARTVFGKGKEREGLTVTLMDVWVLDPNIWSQLNTVCWVPVDHEPAPRPVVDFFRESGAIPIAMSEFGREQLAELDPLYVPHAIDTEVYAPQPKGDSREDLGLPDKFIVGMVAANKGNPSRKCFTEAFQAFRLHLDKHPGSVLYLHTEATGRFGGMNLPQTLADCNVPQESVIWCDQYRSAHFPFPPEHMAKVYSSLDVLLSPSAGEGFGIPVIESQACFPAGTDVVIGDPLATFCKSYTGEMVTLATDRGEFEATTDHPVWTDRGWQSAGSVHPGDRLLYCPDATQGSQQILTGGIERVVSSLRADAAQRSGGAHGDDLRRGVLPVAEAWNGKAVLVTDRAEARDALGDGSELSRRAGRRGGHGHDQEGAARDGQEPVIQAGSRNCEHGYAPYRLAGRTNPRTGGALRLAERRRAGHVVPLLDRGVGPTATLQGARTASGSEGRPDAGHDRVRRDQVVAIQDGPLDPASAADHLASPRAQFDTVRAARKRHVRDLPVYNITTRSSTYHVGAGYLVHNCGTPVIVSDFSAQPELCGAGWLVSGAKTYTPIGSWQFRPDIADIADALEQAHETRGADEFAVKARDKALLYDVEKIMAERMLPALADAAERHEDRPVELVA